MPTLRMYVASLTALCSVIDADNVKPDTMFAHEPVLLPAESIQGAAQDAKRLAFVSWPKEEGWHGHTAIIVPVTSQFFAELKPFLDAGLVPDTGPPEASDKFVFD